MRPLHLLLCAAAILASCSIETSDNGHLDGFWHLEHVDTLATGGTADLSAQYIFWGVQYRLMYAYDSSNDRVGSYYMRFEQTQDSLHITHVYLNHGHEDNPSVDQGGDLPVGAVNDSLRHFGLNALPEHFLKERLDRGHMTLRTKTLRLRFRKF